MIVLAVAFSGAEFDAPKETGVTGSAWCDKLRSVFPWSGMGRPYRTIAKTKLQIEKCGILAPDTCCAPLIITPAGVQVGSSFYFGR